MPFENATANITFRRYQLDMLEVFEQCRLKNERKFHLVAPPGSGKTIIGLELMRRLGQPAVVFSPNQAIQSGWLTQLKQFSFDLSGAVEPDSGADLISLTYQSISVKQRGEEALHANATALLAKIAHRSTLIFDECHHLTDYWARVLLESIRPGQYIIALTATPPRDRSPGEWENYIKLLGEIDYEIILPPVIKEGFLAPYQDLVYTVSPSAEEVDMINRLCEPYRLVMEKLLSCTGITPVHFWAENLLADFHDPAGAAVPFDEALRQQPELVIPLVRFVQKYLGDLPPAVFLVEEMEDPLTFEDVLMVLREYVLRYLGKQSAGVGADLYLELKHALREIGYKLSRRSLSVLPGGVKGIISLSESKMAALGPIVERELICMQEELRLLILTDCERAGEKEGTGAVEVLRFLTESPNTDRLDPILVTGRTILVDDDLVEVFLAYMKRYLAEHDLNCSLEQDRQEGFCEIRGSGPDWCTRTYVACISRMLEEGVTRCLISTRSLLGEGWNSERLNTLIDLTVVTSYAFVNQIRGRTIRLDPDKPFKTANNWDVVALLENPIEGSYDLKRVCKKYSCFYGLSEDNVIEAGIGHVHPLLTSGDASLILGHLAGLNGEMLERCGERLEVYRRWEIGKGFSDTFSECVEVLPLKERRALVIPPTEKLMHKHIRILAGAGALTRLLANISWVAMFIIMAKFSLTLWPLALGVFCLSLVLSGRGGTLLWAPLTRLLTYGACLRYSTLKQKLTLLARVLLLGLQQMELCESKLSWRQIRLIRREDGRYRLFLAGSKHSREFARGLRELLAPVGNQKYFIYERILTPAFISTTWSRKVKGYLSKRYPLEKTVLTGLSVYPIPQVFARNAETRRVFLSLWQAHVCPSRILTGGELGREHLHKRPLAVIVKAKRIWY